MRADVVVPEPKEIQILLGFRGLFDGPLVDQFLEGLEESLDAPVLPGREGCAVLMPDAEETKSEPEERGGEDSLVVGPEASRLAEAFDCVQYDAEDRDRGLVPHVAQCQTGAGTVIEQPEDGALSSALADVGEVEGPNDVRRHRLGPMVLEPAADAGDLVLALPEHVGDEGLADRNPPPRLMQVVEDDRDLPASAVRHQGLEAQDFLVDPWRLWQVATACGRHRYLGSAPSRCRSMTSGASQEHEQGHEGSEEEQEFG